MRATTLLNRLLCVPGVTAAGVLFGDDEAGFAPVAELTPAQPGNSHNLLAGKT